ncbi:integrase family protein [Sinirhodobacter sp. WL0062]|uniref:Integrase family protein n=1 Tax=Rhodobacter flavimaris TaxID=2907145 RepID=A0ABS8YRI5_9RHOB|nr:integrase family protein [Sinirhodobacter sp. WL0062]MCE5972487.1 integrase family protein [Sinirhodobacter sp. WL0062]
MPTTKLTKGVIDRLKPGPKNQFVWDSQDKGFGAKISPAGKITFIIQKRMSATTPTVRITIGDYGVFTVDQARDVAQEHLRSIKLGLDPRAVKKQSEAEAVTLQQIFDDYVARPDAIKDSTRKWYEFFVTKVFADWRKLPIVSITPDMVLARHRKMSEKGLDGKRGAPKSADSAMVALRILINYASRQHRRADGSPLFAFNPVDVMADHWAKKRKSEKLAKQERKKRYVAFDKVGEVWNALHDARLTARNRDALAGVDLALMLLLTGCRNTEMASITWDRIHLSDDPAACWYQLIDRKQGFPIQLPLSTQAVAVLKGRKREEGNPHVFPSRGSTGHMTDPRATMTKVSEAAGKHLSPHDLRRTFSNIAMRECRVEKFRVDLLIGHKPAQEDITSLHYADLDELQWLHPEVQAIGDWIERKGLIAAGKNVLPMAARA